MRAKMFHQLLSTYEEDQLRRTMSLKERLQSIELTDYPHTDCSKSSERGNTGAFRLGDRTRDLWGPSSGG